MKKEESALGQLITFALWVSGILVVLAVGFGMIDGTLTVRFLPLLVTQVAGWVSVIAIIAGAVLAIIERFR